MPKTTAYIQEHDTWMTSQLISHKDGELVWEEKFDGNTSVTKCREEEIVLILKKAEGYTVFTLRETPDATETPFELGGRYTTSLPEFLLDLYLVKDLPAALSRVVPHRLHVVVSTRSGTGQAEAFFEGVVRPLLVALYLKAQVYGTKEALRTNTVDHTYNLVVTESSNTVKEFARSLWPETNGEAAPVLSNGHAMEQTIILLSGDGGVVDLLNNSHPSQDRPLPCVAQLPLGTGNALFHSLHKARAQASGPAPSPLVLGLRTLFKGTPAPLPNFKASFSPGSKLITYSAPTSSESEKNGDQSAEGAASKLEERTETVDHLYGAIVASYGFHAQLVWESDTPAYRAHGDKRFGMVARELLQDSHDYRADVAVRPAGVGSATTELTKLPRERFNYVLAAMVSNLEKTFTISPASKPLDGRLRLVHFGDVDGARTMEIMMAAYREGEHVGMRWQKGSEATSGESGEKDKTVGSDDDGVGYEEVEEVRVTVHEENARFRKVCIDGTIVEVPLGGWMSVKRTAESRFRVLVDRSLT